VLASLDGRIALVIDDGPTSAGLESTIVKDGEILRPGPITAADIEAVCSRQGGSPGSRAAAPGKPGPRLGGSTGEIVAPGQLASHYAPSKPLRLDVTTAAPDEWLIGFGAVAGDDMLSASGDLVEAAARLFDALHVADASPRPRIAVAPIPDAGVGAAINDRLRRAAHGCPLPTRNARKSGVPPDLYAAGTRRKLPPGPASRTARRGDTGRGLP
jgi:L-threonylcarbamoyladenylate synthase